LDPNHKLFRRYYIQFKYVLYFGAVLINFILLLSVQVPRAFDPATGSATNSTLTGDDRYAFGEQPEYAPPTMEHLKVRQLQTRLRIACPCMPM
jgi:hypothetical protein